MSQLHNLHIEKCFFKNPSFGLVQLHFFADASQDAYGVVAYLRVCNFCGKVNCSFLIGNARLVPITYVSIPRLELTAATLAVKLRHVILIEFGEPDWETYYWTDSTAVLFMISNRSKRFPAFVANRLAKIDELYKPNQWRYVTSALNPAYDTTRGLTASNLFCDSCWLRGSEFLFLPEQCWPQPTC